MLFVWEMLHYCAFMRRGHSPGKGMTMPCSTQFVLYVNASRMLAETSDRLSFHRPWLRIGTWRKSGHVVMSSRTRARLVACIGMVHARLQSEPWRQMLLLYSHMVQRHHILHYGMCAYLRYLLRRVLICRGSSLHLPSATIGVVSLVYGVHVWGWHVLMILFTLQV